MLRLKATSRIGKAQIARTGSTLVGDPQEIPRSEQDRAADADLIGPKPGDTVRVLDTRDSKGWAGYSGTVRWLGPSKFGGEMQVGVDIKASPKWVYVAVSSVTVVKSAAGGER